MLNPFVSSVVLVPLVSSPALVHGAAAHCRFFVHSVSGQIGLFPVWDYYSGAAGSISAPAFW